MRTIPPKIEALPSSQYGVKVVTFEKERIDSHWHFHPEFELVWMDEGEGILHAGRALYPYRAGQLVVLGANLPHAYASTPTQGAKARWTVLHFRHSLWGDAFWELPENKRILRFITRAECGYVFSGTTAQACAERMKRIETRQAGQMPLAVLLQLLYDLALERKRHRLNPSSVSGGKRPGNDPRLGVVLERLERCFRDASLTQAQVAGWLYMSPQSFSRFFHQQSGRPFQQHLNELRIARVCARLQEGEQTVAEIAFESGYSSLSNFNRRFREVTGCTPSTYRASLRAT